jgi:hypothetical protein
MLVLVAEYGGFAVVTPMDAGSRAWLDEHVVGEITRWAGGIVVEHEYLDGLLCGMVEDGIELRRE